MRITTILALAAAGTLAACGGDDMGNNPPPDQPPSFGLTQLEVDFQEGGTDPVATLTVVDDFNIGVALALSGLDSALFSITQAGVLTFRTPPDFESPQDSGANNVYELTVTAIDQANNTATVDVTVTVTDNPTASVPFLDPVFAQAGSLGSVTMVGAGGTLSVEMVGPAGGGFANAPLLVLGGTDAGSLGSAANALAMRGYLVAVVPTNAPADLKRVASSFGSGSQAGFAVQTGAIGVIGIGNANYAGTLFAAFSDTPIPSFALGGEATLQMAASHFHAELARGRH